MSDHEPAPPPSRRLPEPEDFPEHGPNALGSFGQRAGARILDALLIALPFSVVIFILVGDDTDATLTGAVLVVLALAIAVQAAYEIGCVAVWGRTLGKVVFGLRVVRFTDGQAPTWAQAVLRARYLILLVTDLAEHYAQIAGYMRILGLVPPSALPQPQR